MKYQIRWVEKKDIEQLVELCALHAKYELCNYTTTGKKEALKQAIFSTNSELKCLVIEIDQELIGYATFIRQFATWDAAFYLYMDCLYLKKEYRGYGIGKALLDQIKQEASEMGCFQIQWQTPVSNKKAIKFYNREGALAREKVRFYMELN